MEKKFTLSAGLILLAFFSFSQCPNFFKRNNGNGTCGAQSEIRMYFPTCVSNPPVIDSIYVNNVKADLAINAPDGSKCAGKGYVSYCFSGNLPTASSLHIFFTTTVSGTETHISCFVPEGNVAPVVLSNFETQRNGSNTVNLTWKTEQEVNAKGFEIQRSLNNSSFETIGFVPSKNSNSSISQFYSFTDNSNSSKGVSFYRIKMIDKDNSYALSLAKSVKASAGTTDFTVFPNPSSGNTKITVTDLNGPIDVMILDNSGRLIKQTTLVNKNAIEISNLQKGGYFIKITGKESGSSLTKKLSVIN